MNSKMILSLIEKRRFVVNDEATSFCEFPRDFAGFEGHFPHQPVLPALYWYATPVL